MFREDSSPLRQLLAMAALALALTAQQLTVRSPYEWWGWLAFAGAALLAIIATPAPQVAAAVAPVAPSGLHVRRLLWGGGAVLAMALTTALSTMDRWPVVCLALWVASFFFGAAALRDWLVSPPVRGTPRWTQTEYAALGIIVVLAVAARALWIDSLPRYYFGDEPRVGIFLKGIYRPGVPNFFTMGWNTWPMIGLSVQGLFAPLLGLSTTTLRLSSALMGTLAVGATYLLARELFTPRVALLSALLLAIGRTAIDFSRLGTCHAQVMFLEPLAFFWWWRAVNTGRAAGYLWTGVGLGLCLYTYNAGQSVPLAWLGWLGLCVVFAPRTIRTHWRGAAITLAGFVLAVFPWIFYTTDHFAFRGNWEQWTIMARNRQALSQALEAWHAAGLAAGASLLVKQAYLTWLGFNVLPGGSYMLGYRGGGMLDHVTAPLFVLGLALLLRRVLQGRDGFVPYWWLFTAFVGGVLTVDPPAYVRLVGILPALAILAAVALDWLLRVAERTKLNAAFGLVVVAALLAGAGWDNWRTYFVAFPKEPIDDLSALGRRLRHLPATTPVRLLGSEHYLRLVNEELFPLDFPGRDFLDVPDPAQFLPLHEPIDSPPVLILGLTQLTLVRYLKTLYPHTQITDVWRDPPDRRLLFRIAELTREDLDNQTGIELTAVDAAGAVAASMRADAFASDLALPATSHRLQWTGSIYWPTDGPVTLGVSATRATALRVAGVSVMQEGDPGAIEKTLTLPRGWQPIDIDEQVSGPRTLTMSLVFKGTKHALTRWDLRPSGAREGLTAVYERNGQSLMRTMDPQLNSMAVEDNFRLPPGNELPVKMPFTASWQGGLRITTPGLYAFEAVSSGPCALRIDDTPLLELAQVVPEDPRSTGATRHLTVGIHPIVVHFDSTKPASTTRWQFQVYWTPPGGERELIPPTNLVPDAHMPHSTNDAPGAMFSKG